MIGEFPKEDTITIRLHAIEKNKARDIPFSYYEIFKCGLDHLSKEINQLEERKAVLETIVAENTEVISKCKTELTRINNRIRVLNPEKLDKETLQSMLKTSAIGYAKDIYNVHGENSFKRIEVIGESNIRKIGSDWGFDGAKFLEAVLEELSLLCNTGA